MVNREWGCKPTLAHGWKSPVMPHVRCIGTAGPARCLHFNTGGAVQRSSKSATTFLHKAVQKECRREQRQQTGLPSPWNRPAQHRPIGGILAPRAHRKPLQRQATPFPPGYKTRPSRVSRVERSTMATCPPAVSESPKAERSRVASCSVPHAVFHTTLRWETPLALSNGVDTGLTNGCTARNPSK